MAFEAQNLVKGGCFCFLFSFTFPVSFARCIAFHVMEAKNEIHAKKKWCTLSTAFFIHHRSFIFSIATFCRRSLSLFHFNYAVFELCVFKWQRHFLNESFFILIVFSLWPGFLFIKFLLCERLCVLNTCTVFHQIQKKNISMGGILMLNFHCNFLKKNRVKNEKRKCKEKTNTEKIDDGKM